MGGTSKNCDHNHPCAICGKTDWCNYVTFPSGDVLAYCHRIHGNKGETTLAFGKSYIAKFQTKDGFTAWEPLEQYETNRQEFLKEKYPDGKRTFKNTTYKQADNKVHSSASNHDEVIGVSSIQRPEILDKFYRTLLDILVLEEKHEKKLRMEWDMSNGVYDDIMSSFPIKSLPPEDKLRFSSKERLNNLSRKKIMEKLVEICGIPEGVPGFYERRDGAWTMSPLCGIVYPVFDTHGHIIRIRVGVDYPQVKGDLNGKDGRFIYTVMNETAGWYFFGDDGSGPILAWEYGGNNLITLNKKGYPEGKVNAKYMNFTSYKEVEQKGEDGTVRLVNKYNKGCASSSYASLYSSDGNDHTFVYITEGEKKAIVANRILNVPTISLPGVNSFMKLFDNEWCYSSSMIDSLIESGTKGFVLVFDADKSVNEAVLYYEKSAIEEFKKRNLLIAIGEWNPNWGKGLDDVLLTGVMPDVHLVTDEMIDKS